MNATADEAKGSSIKASELAKAVENLFSDCFLDEFLKSKLIHHLSI